MDADNTFDPVPGGRFDKGQRPVDSGDVEQNIHILCHCVQVLLSKKKLGKEEQVW